MDTVTIVIQIVVALGILNVWLIRFAKPTEFRGGNAKDLKDEFVVYGLPTWAFYTVGALKIALALLLLIGIWIPFLILPAAVGIGVLMLGAVFMHVKVKDSVMKAIPATMMLLLSVAIALGSG